MPYKTTSKGKAKVTGPGGVHAKATPAKGAEHDMKPRTTSEVMGSRPLAEGAEPEE